MCPASVEEVQTIVKIANQFHQPVWPVSTGKNMGYGMASTATPGQMVLDLKRMNRIISVDPELCTALVEPGVTYRQLQDYLDEHKFPLWIDLPTVGPITPPMASISWSSAAWAVARIVDAMRPLRIAKVIPNVVLMMSAAYQLALFARRDEVWDKPEPVPDAAFAKAASKVGLGMWNTYFALYGTEGMIAENEKIVRAAFGAIDGEVLTEAEMQGNPYFHHHATLIRGGLSLEEVGLARWKGNGGGLAWFAPLAPIPRDPARENGAGGRCRFQGRVVRDAGGNMPFRQGRRRGDRQHRVSRRADCRSQQGGLCGDEARGDRADQGGGGRIRASEHSRECDRAGLRGHADDAALGRQRRFPRGVFRAERLWPRRAARGNRGHGAALVLGRGQLLQRGNVRDRRRPDRALRGSHRCALP